MKSSTRIVRTVLPSFFVIVLGLLAAGAYAAETYNIDPAHSSVGFAVSHMVINTVHGKFNEFSGTIVADGQVQEAKGTIQTKSVDTGVAMRDKDLRSPNFFDAEKYPTITFQSKRAEKKGGETVLVGDFTMHGVTKEIALPVKLKGPIKDPWGNSRIGLESKTKLNRKDYGLLYNKALETGGLVVGDEIEIEINAEAVKAAAK
jgi:polyisoprenoid-binding protein YceI